MCKYKNGNKYMSACFNGNDVKYIKISGRNV